VGYSIPYIGAVWRLMITVIRCYHTVDAKLGPIYWLLTTIVLVITVFLLYSTVCWWLPGTPVEISFCYLPIWNSDDLFWYDIHDSALRCLYSGALLCVVLPGDVILLVFRLPGLFYILVMRLVRLFCSVPFYDTRCSLPWYLLLFFLCGRWWLPGVGMFWWFHDCLGGDTFCWNLSATFYSVRWFPSCYCWWAVFVDITGLWFVVRSVLHSTILHVRYYLLGIFPSLLPGCRYYVILVQIRLRPVPYCDHLLFITVFCYPVFDDSTSLLLAIAITTDWPRLSGIACCRASLTGDLLLPDIWWLPILTTTHSAAFLAGWFEYLLPWLTVYHCVFVPSHYDPSPSWLVALHTLFIIYFGTIVPTVPAGIAGAIHDYRLVRCVVDAPLSGRWMSTWTACIAPLPFTATHWSAILTTGVLRYRWRYVRSRLIVRAIRWLRYRVLPIDHSGWCNCGDLFYAFRCRYVWRTLV